MTEIALKHDVVKHRKENIGSFFRNFSGEDLMSDLQGYLIEYLDYIEMQITENEADQS